MNPAPPPTAFDRVARINAELAELFRLPPASLPSGATLRARDSLVVCALLGGKDAGKSTLINTVAGQKVSVDTAVVGEGTPGPIAYVHQDAVEALRDRFGVGEGTAAGLPCRFAPHRVETIRDLVLVDLPDMDSTFRGHVETVRAAVERMDRVVWVLDPKKGDDRAVADLLRRVVRDSANVYCVLNKFDELLNDDAGPNGADAFWEARCAWFDECLRSLGLPPDESRRFLVSARYPDPSVFARAVAGRWRESAEEPLSARDRPLVEELARRAGAEMDRFKTALLKPLSPDDVRRVKSANASAELRDHVDRIERHFDLQRNVERLADAAAAIDQECDREFDTAYVATIADRLSRFGRSDTDLAQELTGQRVQSWSILSIVYWPLRGLVRWVGARFAAPGDPHRTMAAPDLFRVRGRSLEHRTTTLRERLRQRLCALPDALHPALRWPDAKSQAEQASSRVLEQAAHIDDEIIARCRVGDAAPGSIRRFVLWILLLWFPLIQPLARGGLELAATRSLTDGLDAAIAVVAALGATSLIKGVVASGLVCLILLSGMFARSLRDVRRERGSDPEADRGSDLYREEVARILEEEIRVPLRLPAQDQAGRVARAWRELLELADGGGQSYGERSS